MSNIVKIIYYTLLGFGLASIGIAMFSQTFKLWLFMIGSGSIVVAICLLAMASKK